MEKENRKESPQTPWEVTDPKPPVVRSGQLEGRRCNENRISS